jgi:hypothetical protein
MRHMLAELLRPGLPPAAKPPTSSYPHLAGLEAVEVAGPGHEADRAGGLAGCPTRRPSGPRTFKRDGTPVSVLVWCAAGYGALLAGRQRPSLSGDDACGVLRGSGRRGQSG